MKKERTPKMMHIVSPALDFKFISEQVAFLGGRYLLESKLHRKDPSEAYYQNQHAFVSCLQKKTEHAIHVSAMGMVLEILRDEHGASEKLRQDAKAIYHYLEPTLPDRTKAGENVVPAGYMLQ